MNITVERVDGLRAADYNPRVSLSEDMKEYQKLKKSIETFGLVEPLIVNDRTGVLVGGHQRLTVLKDLGIENVEVVHVDLDEAHEKALNVALNKIEGKWDADKLEDLLRDLDLNFDIDVELTGFDTDELNTLFTGAMNELSNDETTSEDDETVADDLVPEEDEEDTESSDEQRKKKVKYNVKPGDIWQCGDHLIMCGDCTDESNIKELMGGSKCQLVFTDPPYGMKKEHEGILNDNLNNNKLLEFNKKWIDIVSKFADTRCNYMIFGTFDSLCGINTIIENYKNIIKQNMLVWYKPNAQGGYKNTGKNFINNFEMCLFASSRDYKYIEYRRNEIVKDICEYMIEQARIVGLDKYEYKKQYGTDMHLHYFTKNQFILIKEDLYNELAEKYRPKAFNKDWSELNKEYTERLKEFRKNTSYFDPDTELGDKACVKVNALSINTKERQLCGGHASPKPLELCRSWIKSTSKEGDVVLDMFNGSGSTMMACEQLGRTYRGIELDPYYVDITLQRYDVLFGKEIKLITRKEASCNED